MSDNLPALIDYSKALAASDLLPKEYRGKPANVLVAIEYGRAVGVEGVTAINEIHIINGKPSASASLMAGLVRRAGHTLRVSGDDKRAECTIIRADDPDFEFKTVWTIDRARKAGLLKNPTWNAYPEAMLKARAISECARNACSEILAGVQYTPEELGDETEAPAQRVTAQRARPNVTKPATSNVPKIERPTFDEPDFDESEITTPQNTIPERTNTDVSNTQVSSVVEPELVVVEDEIIDAELVEDEPEPPAPSGDAITPAQLKALHAALNAMGIKDRDNGLLMLGKMIGRTLESTKDLTKAEASRVIDSLKGDADE